jgi:hypothetical protein
MSGRASIFDNDTDFDLSGFAPKSAERGGEAPKEAVRAVSEASKFPSREPVKTAAPPAREPTTSAKREPRRYRTGRNVQLNVKVRAEALDSFYALADRQGWVLGETLEKAVAALEKELSQ